MAKPETEKTKEQGIDYSADRGYMRPHASVKSILFHNFLGGLAWGLGTVIGATVIVGLLIFILAKLSSIFYIGSLINNIISGIQGGR